MEIPPTVHEDIHLSCRCCLFLIMGVLSRLLRGLVRGADRMSEFTSKRGSRTHNKGRGARPTGLKLSSNKFLSIRAMIPEFVVPDLEGFKLKPYVSYRAPRGTEAPLTPEGLFGEVVAPQIRKDFEEGTFNKDQLEKYGFEPTQEGKLFKLYPKNYVRWRCSYSVMQRNILMIKDRMLQSSWFKTWKESWVGLFCWEVSVFVICLLDARGDGWLFITAELCKV